MAAKVLSGLLKWRRKQKEGAIMKPSTFKAIERQAAGAGADNPKEVAGAAYWRAAKSKFLRRRKG